MKASYPLQIVTLWTIFLLGTLFHVQLGLMPLFHGLNVAVSQAKSLTEIMPVFWGMLIFFGLPLGAMVLAVFTDAKKVRQGHFWFTVVYSIFNLLHLAADLFVPPRVWPQVVLMLILFLVGLLLNRVAWLWWRHPHGKQLARGLVDQI